MRDESTSTAGASVQDCPCGAGPFDSYRGVYDHARQWHPDRIPLPPVGTYVRTLHDVIRFPDFIFAAGATGCVCASEDGDITVELDVPEEGPEASEVVLRWEDDEDPMRDVEPVRLDDQDFTAAVARGKREILADAASGVVPRDAANFSALHDSVDANDYAGLTSTYFDGDEEHAFAARVQDALDVWIRGGGLRTTAGASRPEQDAKLDGPYGVTVTVTTSEEDGAPVVYIDTDSDVTPDAGSGVPAIRVHLNDHCVVNETALHNGKVGW